MVRHVRLHELVIVVSLLVVGGQWGCDGGEHSHQHPPLGADAHAGDVSVDGSGDAAVSDTGGDGWELDTSSADARDAAGDSSTQVQGDWWVSPSGDDDHPGTRDKPLETIERAVELAQPGQTVVVRQGVYPRLDIVDLQGEERAPITFLAYPGERVVIDGHSGGPDDWHILHLRGICSHLVFDGFEITNSDPLIDQLRQLDLNDPDDLAEWKTHLDETSVRRRNGVRLNSSNSGRHHHLVFRNLKIHHLMGLGFTGIADDVVFEKNHVFDLGRPRSGYGWYTKGLRHTYRDNVVHDTTTGFHLYSPNRRLEATLEGNIVYNTGATYWHMSSETVKEGGVGILIKPDSGEVRLTNNLVYDNRGGLYLDVEQFEAQHNTVVGSERYGIKVDDGSGALVNNLLWNNGSDLQPNASTSTRGNFVGVDPLLVDIEGADFRLTPESPAIDAGERLDSVTHDIAGTSRPQGQGWEPGAYEFRP